MSQMNQIFLNASTPDLGNLVTVWYQVEDVCLAQWGTYASTGGQCLCCHDSRHWGYTLKVAQSAVTKCWHMYPTILWRTGLLLTWSLMREAVILQCNLMFQCLPFSEIYNIGIPQYIHCQHIPITSWHPSQISGRLVGTMTYFLQKIHLYTGHLRVTCKDISRSGVIRLFNPKLLSW